MTIVTQTADVSVISPRVEERYEAQRVLWTASRLPRVQLCGRRPRDVAAGVSVRVTTDLHGVKTSGFAGLQTCGSVWACPVCSAKILEHRSREISRAAQTWMDRGGVVVTATFTVRHSAADRIVGVWDAIQASHEAMWDSRDPRTVEDQETYGVRVSGPRPVCPVKACRRRHECARPIHTAEGPRADLHRSKCLDGQLTVAALRHAPHCLDGHPLEARIPWVRVVEVTEGSRGTRNGWHVHQHMVMFLPAGTTQEHVDDLYGRLWARWSEGAASVGVSVVMVNRAEIARDPEAVGRYVADEKKRYSAAERVGLETARGDLKAARFGNRTMMQLLADFVATGDADDLDLWHEFEAGSEGRRAFSWSYGARDLLGLGVEDTDEEIAGAEVGSVVDNIVRISGAGWVAVCRIRGARSALRVAAVTGGVFAVCALLDEYGAEWALPD